MSPLLRRTTQHLWNFSRLSSTPCVIRPGSTSGAFGPSMDQSHLHPAQRMDHSSSRGRTLTISESPRASARTCQPHPRTVAHVNEVDGCRDRMVRSFRASANSSVTSFSSPALIRGSRSRGAEVAAATDASGRRPATAPLAVTGSSPPDSGGGRGGGGGAVGGFRGEGEGCCSVKTLN